MIRRFVPLAAAFVTALAVGACAKQPDAEPKFRVAVKAKMTIEADGREEKIEADAAFEYTWKRDGKVRTLVVDLAEVRAVNGGQEAMNAKMSRTGFIDTKGGKTTEVKTEDAPAQLKKMLTDSFGSPLCKIEVDDTGKEVKRTIVAGPGATPLIDNGMVANATLFHPWYSADKNEWEADLEVSAGSGLAKGKATYTKVPGGKGGQAVKVTANLTANGVKGQAGLTIKDGKYKVTGEQTYDTDRKEWVSGKMTMDLAFQLSDGAKVVATAKGEMEVTFGLVPGKK